jgi:SAM-dependent methyltransferase
MKLAAYSRWEESKDKKFLAILEYNSHAKVVDLGCGDGKFSFKVKERIGCGEMWGVDVDEMSLEKAENRGIAVKKVDLNGVLPLEAKSFDVVVSNQVIEHLFYPVRFMREAYRILKPDGYAVISTENLSSWDNLVALLFGYTPFSMEFDCGLRKIGNPFSPHEKELKGEYTHSHVRIFSWNGLVELARFLRFKLEEVAGNGHFLGRFGETIDKKHCRFITLKLRKLEDEIDE